MLHLSLFSLLYLDVFQHFTLFAFRWMRLLEEITLSCQRIIVDIEILLPLPQVILVSPLLKPYHIVQRLFNLLLHQNVS